MCLSPCLTAASLCCLRGWCFESTRRRPSPASSDSNSRQRNLLCICCGMPDAIAGCIFGGVLAGCEVQTPEDRTNFLQERGGLSLPGGERCVRWLWVSILLIFALYQGSGILGATRDKGLQQQGRSKHPPPPLLPNPSMERAHHFRGSSEEALAHGKAGTSQCSCTIQARRFWKSSLPTTGPGA